MHQSLQQQAQERRGSLVLVVAVIGAAIVAGALWI